MIQFCSSKRTGLIRLVVPTWVLGAALCLPPSLQAQSVVDPRPVAPPNDLMFQYPQAQPRPRLIEASLLVRVATVRTTYNVNGAGLTCAVLDTGARTTHVDFAGAGKIPAQKNFTADNGGDQNNAADGNGHGTNVGGIVCANGIHTGIAPGARMIPIKVLGNSGGGTFSGIISGLDWVIANRTTYNITCVNMSLGANSNETSDASYTNDALRQRLVTLRNARVAVCIAAGNSFSSFSSQEGMAFPAILREGISVGATYDADVGPFSYGSGAVAFSTGPKRVTPFSQRLHSSTNTITRTDTFAPGAPLTSAGIISDTGESTQHGTSQATPVVAGLVLLAQQYHLTRTGQLPTIDKLESWLRRTNSQIVDGDDEDDNVTNTNKSYFFADAVELFQGIVADIGTGTSTSNVVATYNATTKKLTLTGDVNANAVSVTFIPDAPMSASGTLSIAGLNGTKINNKNTQTTPPTPQTYLHTGPLDLGAVMSDGDDLVEVKGVDASQVYLNFGNGNDQSKLMMCNVAKLNTNGGTGTDTIITTTSVIPPNGPNRVLKSITLVP